ncbi:hypothetical protein AVEN_270486-1 [Araneus ventricosus]|uniref:Uncharacterized protein n=1 Tax=Araneus ventricosus TaxID=182803 RepID=A0A4Y2B4S3_ARAVE|nr:hypothetical protein AVEN_270486-1 [Araneus ventricosus]
MQVKNAGNIRKGRLLRRGSTHRFRKSRTMRRRFELQNGDILSSGTSAAVDVSRRPYRQASGHKTEAGGGVGAVAQGDWSDRLYGASVNDPPLYVIKIGTVWSATKPYGLEWSDR